MKRSWKQSLTVVVTASAVFAVIPWGAQASSPNYQANKSGAVQNRGSQFSQAQTSQPRPAAQTQSKLKTTPSGQVSVPASGSKKTTLPASFPGQGTAAKKHTPGSGGPVAKNHTPTAIPKPSSNKQHIDPKHYAGPCHYGKDYCFWSHNCWSVDYGCNVYWSPVSCCWFYWCAPYKCYYPVDYCPTGYYAY